MPSKVRPPNCRMSCTDEDCYCYSFFYSQLLLLLPLLLLPFGCYHMQEIPDKVPWMKVDLWAGFPEIPVDPENPWTKQMWADIASDPRCNSLYCLSLKLTMVMLPKFRIILLRNGTIPPPGYRRLGVLLYNVAHQVPK